MEYPQYWQQHATARDRRLFVAESMTASDGCDITVYRTPAKRSRNLLVVNPPGVPFLVMSKLAAALSSEFNIVSWEMRGSSFVRHSSDEAASASVDRLARDLVEVIAHTRLETFHIVTASGGAIILTWARAYYSLMAASASLIGPNGIGRNDTETPYKSVFLPMVRALADRTPAEAQRIFASIQKMAAARARTNGSHEQLNRLFYLNLESDHALLQFGRLMTSVIDTSEPPGGNPFPGWAALFDGMCASFPILIQHCRDDDVVRYEDSVEAALRNESARLLLYPSGGHLAMYTAADTIAADELHFIQRCQ